MPETDQYTDTQIIEHILNGQTALFEILIRRNNPFLYKTGRAYNYSHEDTQDLMQETFIDAYKNLSGFKNLSAFKTWIIRIMLNHCYRKKQKQAYKNEIVKDIHENSEPMFSNLHSSTANVVTNRELNHIIENALQQIPIDYRMVFALREMNGLNIAETAGVLNISETNVKVRLNRAKNMLRKEIEKSYSAEDIFEFNLIYCDAIVASVMEKIKTSD
jgi:RNA polymerase sigma-70 factor (ECF subfamily)